VTGTGFQVPTRLTLAIGGLLVALGCLAIMVVPAQAQIAPEDKALGRPASASSVETEGDALYGCGGGICTPDKANDGSSATRWSSAYRDGEYWTVDLGRPRLVDSVSIEWQRSFAVRSRIGVSLDSVNYTSVAEPQINLSPVAKALVEITKRFEQRVSFGVRSARYIRITALERYSTYGSSFWTVSVFGPPDAVTPAPSQQPSPSSAQGPTTETAGSPAPTATRGPFNSAGPSAPPPGGAPSPAKPPVPTSGTRAPSKLLSPFPVVRIVGTATGSGASIRRLTVRAPRAAQVRVRCRGEGCPDHDLRRRGTGRVRGLQRRLRAGAVVQVFVTQKGRVGKYTRFVIRKGEAPRRVDGCALHGARRPTECP
jgi:hypothetical protein